MKDLESWERQSWFLGIDRNRADDDDPPGQLGQDQLPAEQVQGPGLTRKPEQPEKISGPVGLRRSGCRPLGEAGEQQLQPALEAANGCRASNRWPAECFLPIPSRYSRWLILSDYFSILTLDLVPNSSELVTCSS